MSRTKVSRIGNSAGVILSRDTLKELGLSVGTVVEISVDREEGVISIRRAPRGKKVPVDRKFARQVEDFIRKYKPALDELAR